MISQTVGRGIANGVGTTVQVNDVVGGVSEQLGLDLSGGESRVQSLDEADNTSDVRGSHGCSRDGSDGGGSSDPGGGDEGAWGKDLDARSEVGER